MIAANAACRVTETGWRPDAAAAPLGFSTHGQDLAAEMIAASRGILGGATEVLAEEMGAVLDGRFELSFDDGTPSLVLVEGQGVLIPAGESRRWAVLSDHGTLYRVWKR